MLWFVGMGLRGADSLSIGALDVLSKCDTIYIERFTSMITSADEFRLSKLTGKQVIPVQRWFVEDGRELIESARSKDVALVTYGDPFIATTHAELRTRAAKAIGLTKVIYAGSGLIAFIGETGLHYYKFGRTSTIMSDPMSALSVYNVIQSNLLSSSHSLILTEYNYSDSGSFFLDPRKAMEQLLDVEQNQKAGIIDETTFLIIGSRVGLDDQSIISGSIKSLLSLDFGSGPHSMIVTGSLHFTEIESVKVLSQCLDEPSDNAQKATRIGRKMVEKYSPKARRAVKRLLSPLEESGVKEATSADREILDNAQYYIQDAEKFAADGRLELAVLSIGYAEGLIDAIRIQKRMDPWKDDK